MNVRTGPTLRKALDVGLETCRLTTSFVVPAYQTKIIRQLAMYLSLFSWLADSFWSGTTWSRMNLHELVTTMVTMHILYFPGTVPVTAD